MNLRPARVTAAAMIGLTVTLVAPAYAPGAPIDDLKAKAASIKDQIETNGAKIGALGEQLNAAQIELDDQREKITDADARTQAAELETIRLRALLNDRAAQIYKSAGTNGPFDAINTGDANEITSQKKYSQLASGRDDAIIDALADAKDELAEQRAAAESAREKVEVERNDLADAKAEANAAAAKQQELLSQVQGEIVSQEELARERAAAAAAVAAAANQPAANTGTAGGGGGGGGGSKSSARGPAYDGPAPSASGGAGAAVAYAQAQVGLPYCYAGTGPDCFDCSGLTLMAWRQGGISLPHFSGSQGAMFPRVSLDALQPGDLITTSSWSQHVGIWVGGGFVHATHTGDFIRYVPGNGRVVDAVRPG